MITLYIEKDSPVTADILEAAARLVIAHRVVYLQGRVPGAPLPAADAPRPGRDSARSPTADFVPPVLVDGEEVYRGGDEIAAHFEELELFLKEWSRFQSDSCYCDARGEAE